MTWSFVYVSCPISFITWPEVSQQKGFYESRQNWVKTFCLPPPSPIFTGKFHPHLANVLRQHLTCLGSGVSSKLTPGAADQTDQPFSQLDGL